MTANHATALLILITSLTVWLTVQLFWRRMFLHVSADPDALAARSNKPGCWGCKTSTCPTATPDHGTLASRSSCHESNDVTP